MQTGQASYQYQLPPLPLGGAVVAGGLVGVVLVAAIWAKAQTDMNQRKQQAEWAKKRSKGLNLDHAGAIANIGARTDRGVSPPLHSELSGTYSNQAPGAVAVQALAPVAAMADTPFELRKERFWGRLKAEAPWLLQLIERTPLLIWGPQQAGKSSLAKLIAILRKLFVGHSIEVADPQAHRNLWPGCFVVYGSNRDYAAIGNRLVAYYQRIARQQSTPTTSIWDEFTSYESWVDGDFKPYAEGFVKSVLSESQAANEFAILLAHGRTQGYLGGSKGTKEAREKGLVEIEAIPERTDTGKAYPSGRYVIANFRKDEMSRVQDEPVCLAAWLRVETLLELFPELDIHEVDSRQEPDLKDAQAWQRFVDEASPEQIDNLIAKNRNNKDSKLTDELQRIVNFSAGKDWLTPGDIKAGVRSLRTVPGEIIQAWFIELEKLGLGETKIEYGTRKFRHKTISADNG